MQTNCYVYPLNVITSPPGRVRIIAITVCLLADLWNAVYTIQPVVEPVDDATRYKTGCKTGCTAGCIVYTQLLNSMSQRHPISIARCLWP